MGRPPPPPYHAQHANVQKAYPLQVCGPWQNCPRQEVAPIAISKAARLHLATGRTGMSNDARAPI
eukprot:6867460-Pyramimonas_sp.AAC.1